MRSRVHTMLLVCALLSGAGRAALAQAEAAAEHGEVPKVSVEFSATDIQDAMDMLAEQTGIDFVVTPGVEGKLTAKFIDERLDKILRIVAMTLGLEVRLVEGIFVLSKPGATTAPLPGAEPAGEAAPTRPLAGASALLPGTVPNAPLAEAGETPSLVGGPGEEGAATSSKRPRTVTEQIPVQNRAASDIAKALGGGYIDANGRGHAPGTGMGSRAGLPTAGTVNSNDPYRNLPPGARVSRNGTIMMPNGTTILRSGLIILPNGTVIQPGNQTPYLTVPYGTTPGQVYQYLNPYYQPQGTIQGNIGGLGFGLNQNGQAYLQPPAINLGGNATLTLPGVTLGGNNNVVTQPNQIQPGPTMYPGLGSPNVHYGERPSNWFYGLPPDWHFVPPAG